jgi:hypothetical protein
MEEYKGKVYDIDFLARLGWCQVLIKTDGMNLSFVTRDHRMQSVLETALSVEKEARVSYDEIESGLRVLASASVQLYCGDTAGRVQRLQYASDGLSQLAAVLAPDTEVYTDDPRLQTILELGARLGRPVQEVQHEAGRLMRAKINVDLPLPLGVVSEDVVQVDEHGKPSC